MVGIVDRGNLNDEKYVTERSELLNRENKGVDLWTLESPWITTLELDDP